MYPACSTRAASPASSIGRPHGHDCSIFAAAERISVAREVSNIDACTSAAIPLKPVMCGLATLRPITDRSKLLPCSDQAMPSVRNVANDSSDDGGSSYGEPRVISAYLATS